MYIDPITLIIPSVVCTNRNILEDLNRITTILVIHGGGEQVYIHTNERAKVRK